MPKRKARARYEPKMLFNELSIGVDIEDIGHFKKLNAGQNKKFLEKIFTKNEIRYCYSKKTPAQHLVARFAGKEAIIKALNHLNKKAPFFNEIEILNNKKGIPTASLKNCDVKLSLSHCKDKAIAFAIVHLNKR